MAVRLARSRAAVYRRRMTLTLKQLARAIPLVALVGEGEAEAAFSASCGAATGYGDPCASFDGWTELALLSGGTIPADGVLVLQGAFSGAMPALDSLALTVTTGGEELPGVFEATGFPDLVIWRPSVAWTAGATYEISGTATNANGDGECVPLSLPIAGEVTIDAGAAAGLQAVVVNAAADVMQVPTIALDTLACCEGVTPFVLDGGCYGESTIQFDPGQCAPLQETGFLELTLTGTPAAMGPVDQQILYVYRLEGAIQGHGFAPMFGVGGLLQPACVAIDAVDLGTGTVVEGVQACFGDMFVDQLGVHAIDPTAELACTPFVCELNEFGDGWDPTRCMPFGEDGAPTSGPTGSGGEGSSGTGGSSGGGSGEGEGGQDGDKGCACDQAEGPPGWLALTGLLALAFRRRRLS